MGPPHLWCVLLQPGVGRGDHQDPSRDDHPRESLEELHGLRQPADEVSSKHAAKLAQFRKVTGISHHEGYSGPILEGGRENRPFTIQLLTTIKVFGI